MNNPKTTECTLFEILLAIVLFISICVCVRSCNACNDRLSEAQELREKEIPTIQTN